MNMVNKKPKNRPPPLQLNMHEDFVPVDDDVRLLVDCDGDREEETHAEFYNQFESTLKHLLPEEDLMPFNLHTAASLGITASVRHLIERRHVDPNARNSGNWTAIMYASLFSHNETVLYLLEMKANVNLKNPSGKTPLMLASLCGSEETIKILLRHGALLEERDQDQFTALMLAIQATHCEAAQILLDHGANPAVREEIHGQTPLYIAAQTGQFAVARALVQRGVDVDVRTHSGDSAYHVAQRNGYQAIANLIIEQQQLMVTNTETSFAGNVSRSYARPNQLHLAPAPTQYRPKSPYSAFFQRYSQLQQPDCNIPEVVVEDVDAQWYPSPGEVSRCSPEGIECVPGMDFNPFSAWPGTSVVFKQAVANTNRHFKKSVSKPQNVLPTIVSAQRTPDSPASPWYPHSEQSSYHFGNKEEVKLPKDLSSVLANLGLTKYQVNFEEQDIDLQVFLTMNESDLREIGINSLGARRKFLSTIEYFQTRSSHYRISEEFMVNAWIPKKELIDAKVIWNDVCRTVTELMRSGQLDRSSLLVDRLVKQVHRVEEFFNKH